MIDWSKYPNFTEAEFRCSCGCGRADMDADFMERLQGLRMALGFPLVITSGYRCPEYNDAKGYTQTHATGKAADIGISRDRAKLLVDTQGRFGFTGLGALQHGPKRFIHLDTLTPIEAAPSPRPSIWSYT